MLAILLLSACVTHRPPIPPSRPPPRLATEPRSAAIIALAAEDRGDVTVADERWAAAFRYAPRDPGLIAAHYAAVRIRDPVAAAEDLSLLATLPTSDPETSWSVASAIAPDPETDRWLAVAVEAGLDPAIGLAATRALDRNDVDAATRLWSAWKPVSVDGAWARGQVALRLSRPAADDLVAGSLGVPRSDAEIAVVVAAVVAECRVGQARAAASRYPWTRLARAVSAVTPCPGEP